jgi:hypothetical protein
MNPINHFCDAIQQEISSSLDEGRIFSQDLTIHTKNCENCAEFAEFSSIGIMPLLAEALPPAGVALREQILAMPHTARASMSISHPSTTSAWRGSTALSSLAATIVLGVCGYWMIDVHPAGHASSTYLARILPTDPLTMRREVVAIEKDLTQGFAELNDPMDSIQSLLNP